MALRLLQERGWIFNIDLESSKESLLENQSKCLESVIHYVGGVTAPACVKAGVKLVSEVEGILREGRRLPTLESSQEICSLLSFDNILWYPRCVA
jgi:hypothetical protein